MKNVCVHLLTINYNTILTILTVMLKLSLTICTAQKSNFGNCDKEAHISEKLLGYSSHQVSVYRLSNNRGQMFILIHFINLEVQNPAKQRMTKSHPQKPFGTKPNRSTAGEEHDALIILSSSSSSSSSSSLFFFKTKGTYMQPRPHRVFL